MADMGTFRTTILIESVELVPAGPILAGALPL